CGLPVIASDVGGLSEVVEEGVCGRLIAPADAPALADAVRVLAGTPALRAAMGAAARDRAIAGFSLEAMATQTLAFYRDVLGETAVAGRKD
ncbi:MAG: glycosyltransferase, partial [Candidatus Binataceae bacterium]